VFHICGGILHKISIICIIISQMIKMKPSSFAAILPVSKFNEDLDVIMLTSGGHIKRSKLSQFMKVSAKGVAAISLRVS
jgi:DNA gyrase/topoisomerase IV subunit A